MTIFKIFNEAFDDLKPHERDILRVRFTDPIFMEYLEAQVRAARRQMDNLDPAGYSTDKAVDFLYAAKEARLVWQYWTDFRDHVKDWASSTSK